MRDGDKRYSEREGEVVEVEDEKVKKKNRKGWKEGQLERLWRKMA